MLSMSMTTALIKEDCIILLERALLNKSICAFGEDGMGKHGRQDRAFWFNISSIEIAVAQEDDTTEVIGLVRLILDGYDSDVTGHIATDRNFEICLKQLLKDEALDPESLYWSDDMRNQGKDSVVMSININRLIGWW